MVYSFDNMVAKRLGPALRAARLDYVQGSVVLPTADVLPAGDTLLMPNDDGQEFRQYDELRAALIRAAGRVLMYDLLVSPSISVDHVVDGLLEGSEIAELLLLNEPPEGSSELLSEPSKLLVPGASSLVRVDLEQVNDALIRTLSRRPELMRQLEPRRFEELVAELFRDMGYEVRLTPRTRDGGRDVMAFFKDAAGTLLTLVECKRFAPNRRVGVGIVRQLYGVVEAERASRGVIATTSFFTKDAEAFQEQIKYRLSLADYRGLTEWCRHYSKQPV